MANPATLSSCTHGLFCWCHACSHNAVITLADLSAIPADTPVPELHRYLRCSACGSQDVAVRPNWPSLGTVSNHARRH